MLSQSHIRGLLQSLDFSEGTGTTLNDKSGNGNHATVVGGTWTADRFGRSNRAILLDGIDDYIDLGLANYQGDVSAIISAKVITLVDIDPIIAKGYASTTLYPPNFRQILRSSSNALNTHNYYKAIYLVNPANLTSSYTLDDWNLFYLSMRNTVSMSHGSGGRQSTTTSSNITTSFSTTYPILIGKYEGTTRFSNIVVDRIMLFNRFLSGHELSKIANRLKLGDMNK